MADSGQFELATIAEPPVARNTGSMLPLKAPRPAIPSSSTNRSWTKTGKRAIGTNSGFCITIRPDTYSQCQWTLTLDQATITMSGHEAATGVSILTIIGGYARMQSKLKNLRNDNGRVFPDGYPAARTIMSGI
jgi:hypothetical protein